MPQQRSAGQGWSCRARASTAGGTAWGGAAPTALTDTVQGAQGWEINLLSQGGCESVYRRHGWAPLGSTLISFTCMGPSGPTATQCPCVPCSGVSRQHSRLSRDPGGVRGSVQSPFQPRAQADSPGSALLLSRQHQGCTEHPSCEGQLGAWQHCAGPSAGTAVPALGRLNLLLHHHLPPPPAPRCWHGTRPALSPGGGSSELAALFANGHRWGDTHRETEWKPKCNTQRKENPTERDAPQGPHCPSWTPPAPGLEEDVSNGTQSNPLLQLWSQKEEEGRLGPAASFGSAAPQQLMGFSGK